MFDVIIVEDNRDVRQSLKFILECDREINIIGTADNGQEAIKLADSLTPNLILMDIKLPGMNGLEAAKIIKENCAAKNKDIKILILSTFYDDDYVARSHEYGVDGYLLKGMEIGKLAAAIKNTCNGYVTLDPIIYERQNKYSRVSAAGLNDETYPPDKGGRAGGAGPSDSGGAAAHPSVRPEFKSLNEIEFKILKSISNGKSNADIADEMFLSTGTVKNYISKLLYKMNCKNSRELAALGSRAGL